MIKFYSDNEFNDVIYYDDSRTVIIDSRIVNKRQLIDYIETLLCAPYEGDNWDGFEEALRDLSWLKEKNIVLYHANLPSLPDSELAIYIDIIKIASQSWDSKSVNSFRSNTIKCFYALFPESIRDIIQ